MILSFPYSPLSLKKSKAVTTPGKGIRSSSNTRQQKQVFSRFNHCKLIFSPGVKMRFMKIVPKSNSESIEATSKQMPKSSTILNAPKGFFHWVFGCLVGYFCSNNTTMLSAEFKPGPPQMSQEQHRAHREPFPSSESSGSTVRLLRSAVTAADTRPQYPRMEDTASSDFTRANSAEPRRPSGAAPYALSARCPRGSSDGRSLTKAPEPPPSPAPPGIPCIEAPGGCRPPAVLSTTAPPAPSAARRGTRARATGRKRHSLRAGRAAPPSPLSGSPSVNRDQLPRGAPSPPAQLAAMRGTSAAR